MRPEDRQAETRRERAGGSVELLRNALEQLEAVGRRAKKERRHETDGRPERNQQREAQKHPASREELQVDDGVRAEVFTHRRSVGLRNRLTRGTPPRASLASIDSSRPTRR